MVLVLGLGNLLLKDEGVGVHVIRRLRQIELPTQIEVAEAGTAVFDLIPLISKADKLIIVDALQGGEKPGTIYRLAPENLYRPELRDFSMHDSGLVATLDMLAQMKINIATIIFGVEPAEITYALKLSIEVAGKIDHLVDLILKEALGGDINARNVINCFRIGNSRPRIAGYDCSPG